MRASSSSLKRLVALVFTLGLASLAGAQESPSGEGEVQLPEQSDVRIIVDISGSMRDTDPENLRQPAVRLLARLLPEGASAGVWTFGQYVNMLVPHREVNDAWREMAIQRSAQINSVALRTNLGAAIETASDDYFTGGELDQTHFILLTDGKVDISDDPRVNAQEEQRILDDIVAGLIDRGATFHPVALSEAADTEFLKALATRSGGRFQVAETADALNLAFLEALNTAVPQEQIPIEGDGFTVDSGVQEFTALIFWGEAETSATRELGLVRPDGQELELSNFPDNVRWAREAGYDLITVTEPQSGQWRINGELGEGSRVTVVSDLRMVVSPLPSAFSAEQPLDIRIAFFEAEEKITNPDFLGVLEVSLSITSEGGRSGTKVLSGAQPPEDGTYRDTVNRLPAPGLYTFDVVADGQTFSRKLSATVGFTVPEGAEPAAAEAEAPMMQEPESADEPDVTETPAQPAEADEPAEEPAIAAPIDISQVEQPAAPAPETPAEPADESAAAEGETTEPTEQEKALPLWVYGAGGAGVLALAALGWFLFRRGRQQQQAREQAAAERETVEDLEQEPVVAAPEEPEAEADEPEAEEKPGAEQEVEPEPEEIPEVTEPVAEEEDDMAQLEAVIDEQEAALKAQDALPEDESADVEDDADIPVADVPAEEESLPGEEEIPELESEAELPESDPSEADDDEEFGLEDFDLSEFDDLPDYDEDDSALPDDERRKKPDDQEPKK